MEGRKEGRREGFSSTHSQSRVVAGSTGNQDKPSTSSHYTDMIQQPTQYHYTHRRIHTMYINCA